MSSIVTRILRSLGEFLLLTAMTAAVPLIVYVDAVVIGDDVSECSITEVTQETLLLLSTIMFLVAAGRHPESRGFLVLVGGFLACLLIRELDFLFDMVHHGLWLYPALLTAAGCLAIAADSWKTVFGSMAAYAETKSCIFVTIGLLIVMVFSRLFGSGRLMWIAVLQTDYRGVCKAIIQEGLELFGYMFIFYGSCLLPQWTRRTLDQHKA
ncbi:MAG: hypothetical protein ABFC96_03825 [Thermoguttaceae bacterium]